MARRKLKKCQIDDLTMTSTKKCFPPFENTPQIKVDNCMQTSPMESPLLCYEEKTHDDGEQLSDHDETDKLSEEELLEQFSVLQSLQKREEELKIAIRFEKLKKETPPVTDECLLEESIAELQQTLQEIKTDLKMKNMMCFKSQLMETLQRVVLPCRYKNKSKSKDACKYDEEKRRLILDLIRKKKQLNQEISQQQEQIARMEEICVKLNATIDNAVCSPNLKNEISKSADKSRTLSDGDSCNPRKKRISNSKDGAELKQLEAENKKRGSRIQLLSRIIKYLIGDIAAEHNLKDDLKVLASTCEKILDWNYEDLDEIEELCKRVYSIEI